MGLAIAMILAAGWAHGHWTHRWTIIPAVQALAAKVGELPAEADEWSATSEPLDPRELRAAGGEVALQRSYRAPGAPPAEVFLIAGRAASVSSHTPEVCYPGAGFLLGPIRRVVIGGGGAGPEPSEFATAVATRKEPGKDESIRLYWAWNDGRGWRAPSDPRVAFLSAPALCKLYLISPVAGSGDADDDAALALLGRLAAQYGSVLFPGGPTSGALRPAGSSTEG
jgi:hypothetical protein